MIVHGNSRFIKERLFDMSDPYQIIVCDKCGVMSSSLNECKSCNSDKISTSDFGYASKLVVQELMSMSIKVKINLK
jgi:DNA-directed RNA polymerase beta subunit